MHYSSFITPLVVFALIPNSYQQSRNYCTAGFCEPGKKNVGCNPPPPEGGPACIGKNAHSWKFSFLLKEGILHEHNRVRSLMARGLFGNFAPASRMPLIAWDEELESQALNNVRSCVYAHDECRNTKQFRYAGQNIAIVRYYGPHGDVPSMIAQEIIDWESEANVTTQAHLDRLPSGAAISKIGHFTQMVNDRVWKIGCAGQQWVENKYTKVYYLVCNYSYSNMVGEPVYKKGPPASRCTSGEDKRYLGLCTSSERVYSTPFAYVN